MPAPGSRRRFIDVPDLAQRSYFVALLTTAFLSIDDVRRDAPEALQQHMERTRRLHDEGVVLMAGAFIDPPGGPVSTMAVLKSQAAAEDFVRGDPFVQLGKVSDWEIREWANMLRPVDK
jgi:uncharacterized protein